MMRLSPALLILAAALTGCAEMGTILEQAGVPYSTYTPTGSRCTSNTTFQCAQRLSVGSATSGWIAPSTRGDRSLVYSFHVNTPGSYRVSISPVPNGFDTGLEVYDSSYQRVAQGRVHRGQPGYLGLNVVRPGAYYVVYHSRSYAQRPQERFVLSVGR